MPEGNTYLGLPSPQGALPRITIFSYTVCKNQTDQSIGLSWSTGAERCEPRPSWSWASCATPQPNLSKKFNLEHFLKITSPASSLRSIFRQKKDLFNWKWKFVEEEKNEIKNGETPKIEFFIKTGFERISLFQFRSEIFAGKWSRMIVVGNPERIFRDPSGNFFFCECLF